MKQVVSYLEKPFLIPTRLTSISELFEFLKQSISCSAYKDGLQAIQNNGYWNRKASTKTLTIEDYPVRNDLSDLEFAELLVWSSALYGYEYAENILAQDKCRDWSHEALRIATDNNDIRLQILSINYLLWTYLRSGEYKEAEVWLSYSEKLYDESDAYLRLVLARLYFHLNKKQYKKGYKLILQNWRTFKRCKDFFLLGSFTGYTALFKRHLHKKGIEKRYKKAIRYFKLANNINEEALARNNLAWFYCISNQFTKVFKVESDYKQLENKLKDIRVKGLFLDTLAELFTTIDYCKALKYSNRSIDILRKTTFNKLLLSSCKTKIRILSLKNRKKEIRRTEALALESVRRFLSRNDIEKFEDFVTNTLDSIETKNREKKKQNIIEIKLEKSVREINGYKTVKASLPQKISCKSCDTIRVPDERLKEKDIKTNDIIITSSEVDFKNGDLISIRDFNNKITIGIGFLNDGILELSQDKISTILFDGQYKELKTAIMHLSLQDNGVYKEILLKEI